MPVRSRSSAALPRAALSHGDCCARLDGEVEAFAALIRDGDLAVRVPWSRTWRLANLVHHVGAIHRWATNIVAVDARRYLPVRDTDDWSDEFIDTGADRWLRAGGDRLLSVLQDADPDRRVWAWGVDQHVRFWSRRMLHETGIHRADIELTLGLSRRFDPVAAGDGVSEFLENLWRARAWKRGMGALSGDGQRIVFQAADTGERWLVIRHPKGFDWDRHPAGSRMRVPADATVRAAVADLYLLVWRRLPLDGNTITTRGDDELLRHWYRHSTV